MFGKKAVRYSPEEKKFAALDIVYGKYTSFDAEGKPRRIYWTKHIKKIFANLEELRKDFNKLHDASNPIGVAEWADICDSLRLSTDKSKRAEAKAKLASRKAIQHIVAKRKVEESIRDKVMRKQDARVKAMLRDKLKK